MKTGCGRGRFRPPHTGPVEAMEDNVSTPRTPTMKSADVRPPVRAAARQKIYLYAIVAGGEGRLYEATGINQGQVYAISTGQVAAVVSDVAGDNVRPERARLAAHHEVLKKLMAETTPDRKSTRL